MTGDASLTPSRRQSQPHFGHPTQTSVRIVGPRDLLPQPQMDWTVHILAVEMSRAAPKCRSYANAWAEQIPKLDAAGISLTFLSIGDSAGLRATSYKIVRNNSHTLLNPIDCHSTLRTSHHTSHAPNHTPHAPHSTLHPLNFQ